jgi:hypothetical protein
MTTVRVEVEQGEATSTYLNVEQIVRAAFYTRGLARNQANAMVHMPDCNTYRVGGEQASALEQTLARSQLTP